MVSLCLRAYEFTAFCPVGLGWKASLKSASIDIIMSGGHSCSNSWENIVKAIKSKALHLGDMGQNLHPLKFIADSFWKWSYFLQIGSKPWWKLVFSL